MWNPIATHKGLVVATGLYSIQLGVTPVPTCLFGSSWARNNCQLM